MDIALWVGCQNFVRINYNSCKKPGQLQRSKTPKPETPRKKLKNYPGGPDPKFLEKKTKNTKNTQNTFFGCF